jgi:integrase
VAILNDIQIKNWIKNKEYFHGKADGNNLYLCYRKGFTAPVWKFRYNFSGKQRSITIGNYGQVSLSEARKKAKALKDTVSLGYDVAAEKQERKNKAAEQLTASTFGQLADIYIEKMIVGRWKYSDVIKARIDKDIKPHIGQLAVEEVKPSHIDKMLQSIKERNAPSIANDILRWTKRILDYAIKRQIIQYNPASAFNIMDAGGKATARDRVLSRTELIVFFDVMRNSGFTKQNFLTVKLLLLLAVRKSELLEAKITEFDLDNGLWTLPANRTKTKTSIIIPLSKQAIEALNELISLSIGSEWLLPARKVQQYKLPHIHENTLNVTLARIKPLMDMPNFCIHDFRRTARSHLAALGIPSHIAERCLNHKLKGIEGVYNHHDYLDERRNALELWANLLTACETGKDYNVTSIKKHAIQ